VVAGPLGIGGFDLDGTLVEFGGLEVSGPRLDLWRAPTDNDHPSDEPTWRELGLHRLQHRVIDVARDRSEVVVRTRVAPPALGIGMGVVYRWSGTADPQALRLRVEITPEGEWPTALPRLGLRMALPGSLDRVAWFGRGPGEAYADTRQAARVGRFAATVDELQTPYVRPQENGNRAEVRWATITDADGHGLRVEGSPTFDLTARRWTTEELAAARHTTDLVAGEHIHLNIDLAQNGVGTAACGPGVLPAYQLHAAPAVLEVTFRRI
jgi:beta-galactosidase